MKNAYAQQQLDALIRTAVDGIMSIDSAGRVELYNPACEHIFGWREDEVLGRNVAMLMPDRYAHRHDEFIENYHRTGRAQIIGIGREVEGLRKSGEEFPMDLSVGEFVHGEERRFVGIVRDLTERVAAERRLRDIQDQLSHMARVSAVAEMGSALAHELNQPLTAISLFLTASERMLDSDPAAARDWFARAEAECQRAGAIVRRIRQMVERGDQERAETDLVEVARSAIDLCRIAEADGGLKLDTAGEDALIVMADATQVRQILVNLIKNALDATRDTSERRVQVNIERESEECAVVHVADNGPGVSDEHRMHLFSPFVTTKPNGLGIGLSICRTIAENHGGSLDLVDTAEGLPGACFRLRLPVE